MRTQLALTLMISASLATLVHAQGSPGAAQAETVGGAQSIGIGAADPQLPYNPTEFSLSKSNGPHVTAPRPAPSAGYDGQPVQRYHLENAWPAKVQPAPRPAVQQPQAPVPAWPSKIDGITIKQGIRR